jgi:putative FmdB family regulatory protein
MPLYEYRCDACGHVTEIIQRLGKAAPPPCPNCGGATHKMVSAPAIQFKGTGWYVTDYAGEGRKRAAAAEASGISSSSSSSSTSSSGSSSGSSSSPGPASTDSKPADSKPADSKPGGSKPAAPASS